jgi:molecular chaperone IbpA
MIFLYNERLENVMNKFPDLEDFELFSKDTYYPPHNIVKNSDTEYSIELALAGFTKENLEISVENNILTIAGESTKSSDKKYVHKGISTRKFKRAFKIGAYYKVDNAALVDGILTITLIKEVPEEAKPKKVRIL